MPVVVLTTTSASPQTWTVPPDLVVGGSCTVECWGSGGSGAGASGAGGGAGAYSASTYIVTPHDKASGISYTLQAGGAAVTTTTGNIGPDCSFSTNNINLLPNTVNNGAVVGGSFPTNWSTAQSGGLGLSSSIIGFGVDSQTGNRYVDVRVFGTTAAANGVYVINLSGLNATDAALINLSTQYTWSCYVSITGGTVTNLNPGNVGNLQWDYGHAATGYDGTVAGGNIASLTAVPTQASNTGTSGAAATWAACYVQLNYVAISTAVDTTIRIQGAQMEQAAAATFHKSTPGYTLAKGAAAAGATAGGVGGASASCIGTGNKFSGGSGATKANLSGGGGSAGKDGVGATPTTATGGTADNGLGGAGGNPGVSNVEGGGGGNGVATTGGTAGSAGAPGGGGGGETGASGTRTSGAGGRGQVRVTYTSTSYGPVLKPWKQRRMLLR